MNTSVRYKFIAGTLSALLLICFLSTLFQMRTLTNILYPLNALIAAGILFAAFLKSTQSLNLRSIFLLYAVGFALWGTADVAWAIITFSGGAPDESTLLQVLYVVLNCLFAVSLILFTYSQFVKWDFILFLTDLFFIAFQIIYLFWILFMHKDTAILQSLFESDATSILSISTDVIIAICILSLFLSAQNSRIPGFIRIISTGIFSFAIFDLLYYYLSINSLYFPNNISDFLYSLAISIVAFGALWKMYQDSSNIDMSFTPLSRRWERGLYPFVFPILVIVCALTRVVPVQLNIGDFLTIGLPVMVYLMLRKYFRISSEKEVLLREKLEIESALNSTLQARLSEAATAELVFRTVMDPIMMLDKNGVIKMCNNATAALLKSTVKSLIGCSIQNFISKSFLNEAQRTELFRNSYLINIDLDFIDTDGIIINSVASYSIAYDQTGSILGYVVNIHDVTEEKKNLEKLDVLSHYDSLTGLPNRRMFFNCLEASVTDYDINQRIFVLLFLDLDGFKNINDSYSHDIGDALLSHISDKFRNIIRKQDIVARIGGDEFVIILNDIRSNVDIKYFIDRIRQIFSTPFNIKSHICDVGISIGTAVCPDDAHTVDSLMSLADIRMYNEKNSKKLFQFNK